LGQIRQAGSLDRADMNKGIGATVVGLDEAEALGRVEPFYGPLRHGMPFEHVLLAPLRMRSLSKSHCFGISETAAQGTVRPDRQSVYRPKEHGHSRPHLQGPSAASPGEHLR